VDDRFLTVSELFYSIQGESTWAGFPCAFIRLSGCNLRCRYCDSGFTWQEQGTSMSLTEIMQWLDRFPGVMTELTGGEPLLQDEVHPLLELLAAGGRRVLLETNGSLPIAMVPADTHVILDVKCPGSGMDHLVDWENINLLKKRKKNNSRDEVKFVLVSEDDFFWASEIISRHGLIDIAPVLLSPADNCLPPARLAELILKERLQVRLQVQLHRILWPHSERGV
jgi:7-carboxy-7-deazaguanine synthase